ncbi:hypothetical protein VT84_20945 [Gemmata sp. SH-PL17]|uniref:hypothetical protein n=1 Tax=Gemmata sp. SH-PL17 TaxID=1630693 RepID=UPI00078EB2BF|nr:hypothetical protein [Gemmata sp. SH-PL17]AMV26881.1 hypothetical protein VT84_20945 [Gemmata sp. SH-PL17]
MPPKLTGHLLQLLGHALVFLGLGFALLAMVLATNYYSVPFWVFVLAAIAVGAPMMVTGGRINSIGRGFVLGMSPEEATSEYRRGTALLGVYLGVLLLQGAWVAAPLTLCSAGFTTPSHPLVLTWIIAWMFIFCVGRYWITRPLLRAAERRFGR